MPIEEPQDELERIVRKAEDLVSCDKPNCEMKGEYWKCYMGNERKCKVYLAWLIKKDERRS